jgi:molecular chaperone GrpE
VNEEQPAEVTEESITPPSPSDQPADTVPEMVSAENELEQVKAQAAEYLDGWQRSRAELDNFRKRAMRERIELEPQARSETILALLPALDDFDRAMENLPEDLSQHDWVNGVILVHRKLHAQIEALGFTEIEATGQIFDPAFHEAVTHEASGNTLSGYVIGIVRRGYRMGDRVIRPALVRVAN